MEPDSYHVLTSRHSLHIVEINSLSPVVLALPILRTESILLTSPRSHIHTSHLSPSTLCGEVAHTEEHDLLNTPPPRRSHRIGPAMLGSYPTLHCSWSSTCSIASAAAVSAHLLETHSSLRSDNKTLRKGARSCWQQEVLSLFKVLSLPHRTPNPSRHQTASGTHLPFTWSLKRTV